MNISTLLHTVAPLHECSGCGGVVEGNNGVIEASAHLVGYSYLARRHCRWEISVPEGKTLALRIERIAGQVNRTVPMLNDLSSSILLVILTG